MTKKQDNSKNYLPRDISWMYFNNRILLEAGRDDVPLLERLSFLGIYSNNLDEFFRVRVASQSRIAECKGKNVGREKKMAAKVIRKIHELNEDYTRLFEATLDGVLGELEKENIFLLDEGQLNEGQRDYITAFYKERLAGMVIPVWFSSIKHFDIENDANIYLAVRMTRDGGKRTGTDYAFVELPVGVAGRFLRLPDNKDGRHYLMFVDDVVRFCMPYIFQGTGYSGFEAYSFKFTRDAEMEIDNDPRSGVLQKISKGLKDRKRGMPLRVVYDAGMPKDLLSRVMRALELDRRDTVVAGGRYHNNKDLVSFPDCGCTALKYPAWTPIDKAALSDAGRSIFDIIRERDRFIHVPYHNFNSFLRVLQEAAISKDVKEIKITLYRLAKESKVVKALIAAARNGKKVTVVIELLARFDEESNIGWSKKMQDAGVRVLFGLDGLKVHSKILLVTTRGKGSVACISTGNFHEGNARTYTDYILMTASMKIVRDVKAVFEFIEKPYVPVRFRHLLVSPNSMKDRFISLIGDEIKNFREGKEAYIRVKINHITDLDMVNRLYEAARAGVEVSLLVRGNCSLVTTSDELEGNISVHGIIDRYLEHSRIFVFAAGGENKVFIGSADWMPRNLENRVEVVTPVYDEEIKRDLMHIVELGFADNTHARVVDGTGENVPVSSGTEPLRSQEAIYGYYKEKEEIL